MHYYNHGNNLFKKLEFEKTEEYDLVENMNH
jgi:hypothetical protein